MKNASELKEITTAAIHVVLEKQKDRAIKVLNEKIVPQMEQAATQGQFSVNFHVDAGIDLDVIIAKLQDNGYKVTKAGRVLRINWI